MLILYWVAKANGALRTVNFDVVSAETHEGTMKLTEHPVESGSDITDNVRAEPRKLSIEGYVSNKPLLSNLGVNPLNTRDSTLLTFQGVPLKIPKNDRPKIPTSRTLDIPKKQGGAPIFTPGGLTSAVTGAIGSLINGPPPNKATGLGPLIQGDPPTKAFALTPSGDFPNRALVVYELLEEGRIESALIRVVTAFGTIEDMIIVKNALPRTPEDGNGAKFQLDLQQIRIVQSETVQAPKPAEDRAKKEVAKGSKASADVEKTKEEVLRSTLEWVKIGLGTKFPGEP